MPAASGWCMQPEVQGCKKKTGCANKHQQWNNLTFQWLTVIYSDFVIICILKT